MQPHEGYQAIATRLPVHVGSVQQLRLTFDRLIEGMAEKLACRLMVDILSLAHDRGCEAELAAVLAVELAAARLPDMALLRARFAPDPAALPGVVVRLAPLNDYDVLLGNQFEVAA